MLVKIVTIGSSKGICIPAGILEALNNPVSFDLLFDEESHTIQLVPLNEARQGWPKYAADLSNDNIIIDDCFDVDETEKYLD